MSTDFDALVAANMNTIANIARSYTNILDAQDLKQEILIQLWRGFQSFRGESAPKTWLYRVAINTAVSFQRREIKSRLGDAKNRSMRSDSAYSSGLSQNEILKEFVAVLNEVDRAVLMMYLDGLTAAEMENVLGIKANAISVRISRMKAKFEAQFVD